MGRPFLKGLSAALLLALGLTTYYGAFAQQGGGGQDPGDELVTGLTYFAVEDVERRVVVQRGTAGSNGVAFESLSLAPNTRFRIWILHAETLKVGSVTVRTPAAGQFTIPDITPRTVGNNDPDGDGLPTVCEFVLGTSATNPDTDGDGVADGAELANGSDPLDGIPSSTGILASVALDGEALDVCAANSVAIVAAGQGISVVNVFNRMNPQVIARVPTAGTAKRVACTSDGDLVAVACGEGGLSIVDISDPPAARVTRQLQALELGGNAEAVTVVDRLAYVGLSTGRLVSVDLTTGSLLEALLLNEPVVDVAVAGDFLYVLTAGALKTIALNAQGTLAVTASVSSPLVSPALGHQRVVVGGEVAYAVHLRGYNTFDVSDPSAPSLIADGATPEFGWRDLALNGSGLGVVPRGNVILYDVSDPSQTNEPQGTVPTPGTARAAEIFNAIAYVADGAAGLQAINYLPADTGSVAPTITLSTNFNELISLEEGQLARVTATCSDDVQVRAVEWYLDGELQVDGSFPFELFFTSPRLAEQQSVSLRARVFDTAGNFTWTPTFTLQVTADTSAPTVRRVVPRDGVLLSQTSSVVAYMSEPLDPQTLTASSFTLTEAGPDATFGTGDDVAVSGGSFAFRTQELAASRTFAAPLPAGRYRAQLTSNVTDLAGVALVSTQTWSFTLYGTNATDSDGDGLPDLLEQVLGLNPNLADTDGDGTPDGDEDADSDGLSNRGEVLLGYDPTAPDTDGNGTLDGAEDRDQDGLSDGQEVSLGTSPFVSDSDGDGFNDGDEVADQSDPTSASSRPIRDAHSVLGVRNEAAPEAPRDAQTVLSIRNQRDPAGTNNVAEVRVSIQNQAPPAATEGSVEGPSFSVQQD